MGGFCLLQREALQKDPLESCAWVRPWPAAWLLTAVAGSVASHSHHRLPCCFCLAEKHNATRN